jgi:hypothetical protein
VGIKEIDFPGNCGIIWINYIGQAEAPLIVEIVSPQSARAFFVFSETIRRIMHEGRDSHTHCHRALDY